MADIIIKRSQEKDSFSAYTKNYRAEIWASGGTPQKALENLIEKLEEVYETYSKIASQHLTLDAQQYFELAVEVLRDMDVLSEGTVI